MLTVFPLATTLLGMLLAARVRRARTAEALRLSEERLRLALASSQQGSFDIDLATGAATVSEEYARMLGYDPATFRDSHAQWIERMHPDDREGSLAIFRDYMAGKLPEYRGNSGCARAPASGSGSSRWGGSWPATRTAPRCG